MNASRIFWRITQIGPRVAYALGLGQLLGKSVLLLTTRGRKTGRSRVTPLVYEKQKDIFIVASARGQPADWIQNILVSPRVRVRVGRREFDARAEVSKDPELIADYLEHQIERAPAMFGSILRREGLSVPPTRAELVRFAPKRPMVLLYLENDAD